MGRASNRKKQIQRKTSPLSAHKVQRKWATPPILSGTGVQLQSWLRDVFPDFFWMCSLIRYDPERGMHVIAETLDTIAEALGTLNIEANVWGRLTQFEAIPLESRERVLDHLEKLNLLERAFPEGFAHALAIYPDAPGRWIVSHWFSDSVGADSIKAEEYLAPVVTECFHGQYEIPTLTKFLYLRGMMKSGKIQFPSGLDTLELLPRYPKQLDEDERERADAFIRATFLAMINPDFDEASKERLEWCKQFWRANWDLYACINPPAHSDVDGDESSEEAIRSRVKELHHSSREIKTRLEHAVFNINPDLYAPDRYEVLTGMATRAVRLALGAVASPLLWTDEFGSSLMRSVVEAKILIRWLGRQDDYALYTKYKEYGRGRLKLLKLHVEEYIDQLDDVPAYLEDYLVHLSSEVNTDLWEEFQSIDLDSTFSNVPIRRMAIDVGLKNDYDLVFSPASGSAHGDWTALDRYALSRCRNSLHMWHRIADFDHHVSVDPSGVTFLLTMADDVVTEYITILSE